MNEGGGNVVQDLSGNGYDATFVVGGDTCWAAGRSGPAVKFDGTGDYIINDTAHTKLRRTDRIAVEAYVYLDSNGTGADRVIFYCGDLSGTRGYVLYYTTADSMLTFAVRDTNAWEVAKSAAIAANTWYHVVGVYDGSAADNLRIYVNGVLGPTTDTADCIEYAVGNETCRIGTYATAVWPWYGLISYVRVYANLTASEVAQLKAEPFCMFEQDDIALWTGAMGGEAPTGNAGIMTTWGGYWGATY